MSARQDLVRLLAEGPGAIVEDVSKTQNATAREVVEALPAQMRKFAPGRAFIDTMKNIGDWGDVTLIVLPAGEVGGGYYNVPGGKGLHAHLRQERCAGIPFVERPFFGRLSASVLFLNTDGGIMFKVFVGRDENRELKPDQLEKFRALADRLSS